MSLGVVREGSQLRGLGSLTSTSKKSSKEIWSFLASSSAAFFSDFKTKPGGRACRYMHLSPVVSFGRRMGAWRAELSSPPLGYIGKRKISLAMIQSDEYIYARIPSCTLVFAPTIDTLKPLTTNHTSYPRSLG